MKYWERMISMELCLWLLALFCVVMGGGSFLLRGDYAEAINAMPLLVWLRAVPLTVSWWLWLVIALLALLVANTCCCSVDTLVGRWGRVGWGALWGPQLMHVGFLLIVGAHLVSAFGASVNQYEVSEGTAFRLPDGTRCGVSGIGAQLSPRGMPIGYSCDLVTNLGRSNGRATISPNHPWFSGGYGVYVKHAETFPYRRALLEVHREPGAPLALAGGVLFTVGNLVLLVVRARQRESDRIGREP